MSIITYKCEEKGNLSLLHRVLLWGQKRPVYTYIKKVGPMYISAMSRCTEYGVTTIRRLPKISGLC